jgi:hypothetical protein
MSEMAERVSRALYPDQWASQDTCLEIDPDYYASPTETEQRVNLLAQGRRALEAMRIPTEAMIQAGIPGPINNPLRIWRAMIDAALQDDR